MLKRQRKKEREREREREREIRAFIKHQLAVAVEDISHANMSALASPRDTECHLGTSTAEIHSN